ncbi:hypothetical protein [Actinacidiphila bryophytorum]|uniref:hypothetical protein n=1 Tax=Actinacidiphila bryophytorum TaxID=1436133 RepID=UPI002176A81D|nr:hypothetical protein [Actinacidiphila bryophytorum]UWE12509.1 hypothetical protein NYE86_30030 [Actinacidiphila bryophytorum]
MNRWALQRYTTAEVWLRAQTDRVTAHLTTRKDRGQTSFEYLGIAVVIAVIIGVLATTSIGDAVQKAILKSIRKISGGGK